MKASRSLLINIFKIASLLTVLFGLSIFLFAGTLNFWNGWLFITIFVICSVIIAVINPELTKKRAGGIEKEKHQVIVKVVLTLCAIGILLFSGLNYRNDWSSIPIPAVVIFTFVMVGAFVMLFIVVKQNSFATRVVEIQENQKIIDTGIYSIVRHPMYLAFTIIFAVSPIVLGSLYSLIPALFIPFLLGFRIQNEEEVLKNGLVGYDTYTKKVKYRLIPFIW